MYAASNAYMHYQVQVAEVQTKNENAGKLGSQIDTREQNRGYDISIRIGLRCFQ